MLRLQLPQLLNASRLAATGCPDSALAQPSAVPASAWKYLRITDLRRSVVTEQSQSKREIFNVRIFPVLEAPNAIDLLADHTLRDVFQSFVLEDPEVAASLKRTCPSKTPELSALERVSIADPAERIAEAVSQSWGTNVRSQSRIALIRVLESRILRLQDFLAKGTLTALGTCPRRDISVMVPKDVWSRPEMFVDFANGHLYEAITTDDQSVEFQLLAKNLTLHRSDTIKGDVPTILDSAQSHKVDSVKRTVSAQTQCQTWLKEQMEASPNQKPKTIKAYWQAADAKWPGLSKRAFDRAWAGAIKGSGAHKWAKGGRPRKSPH
jgi:hypothetical protein